ncbi:hypothetical protein BpHYR1_042127 [Brachionus plicatilis]|uniref:Uncharacterized protein n=1 Tax=Brachionus plicatilis TaxID=10195 RepID=A0A3M7R2B6_BRAPC|nr:hypothetical protein BpHYR1_042127 [Brachionus plicatilis]
MPLLIASFVLRVLQSDYFDQFPSVNSVLVHICSKIVILFLTSILRYNLKLTCTFPFLDSFFSSTLPKEKVGKGKVEEESYKGHSCI